MPRLGLATLVSPYEVGMEKSERLHRNLAKLLSDRDMTVIRAYSTVDSDEAGSRAGRLFAEEEVDAICLLYGTYADDTFATSILEHSDAPTIVWGTNDYDSASIAGAQQLSSVLTELGRYHHPVFGDIDDRGALDQAQMVSRVAAARKRISSSRIGVIGYPRIPGQTQAAFDELEFYKKFGARIIGIGTHRFSAAAEKVSQRQVEREWQKLSTRIGGASVQVNEAQISEAVRAFLAMRRAVRENNLDALAVQDAYDFLGVPNLGMSMLNEEGIPTACEADVHTTLTLHLLALLTGRPTFHGELLGVVERSDAILVGHYGAGAPSLARSRKEEGIRLEPDRSSGRGVSLSYLLKEGHVTVASLTGRVGTYRMLIAPGKSVRAEELFRGGINAFVRFRVNHREFLKKIKGMSHHWVIGLGDVSNELVEFCKMTGVREVLV